mgnify:CR=1 FL=1
MKPTLFVLAAGMGSRYGGLKQLDGLVLTVKRLWTIRFSMLYAEDSVKSFS